jgi:hypothetical protein
MDDHLVKPDTELEVVIEEDGWARRKAKAVIKSLK